MKALSAIGLLLVSLACHAETPQQIRQIYVNEASQQASFTPSAKRGEAFFRQRFAINDKMPACSSCHTDNPLNVGQHAVTGKNIRPLAIAANAERFSDPAKVEKWFGRNCKEVVGRACTPAEKADFMTYLSEVR
jgi:mono/diheme cytochrome c family protein